MGVYCVSAVLGCTSCVTFRPSGSYRLAGSAWQVDQAHSGASTDLQHVRTLGHADHDAGWELIASRAAGTLLQPP